MENRKYEERPSATLFRLSCRRAFSSYLLFAICYFSEHFLPSASTDCTSSDGVSGCRRLTCATDSSVPSWIVVLPTLAAGGYGGLGSSARTRTSMPFTFFSSSLIAFDPVIL